MYDYIAGDLAAKSPTEAVIEANGVGYRLRVPLSTYERLPDRGHVRLFTYLQVREDAHVLYGFASENERAAFQKLISVSGVGPALATTILSGIPVRELCACISASDVAGLSRIKGIGRKTAERIIADLRDEVGELAQVVAPAPEMRPLQETARDALAALISLGYARSMAERALASAVKEVGPDAAVEELVRVALRGG